MNNGNNGSSIGLKVALGIALALFVGTGIYTSSLYKDKKENEIQLTEEKNMVMKDLTAMAAQYDLAINENDIANQSLIEAKDRIEGLIDSLQTAETNVKSLWKYKKKYLSLQDEMNTLLAENDKLKVENQLLATSLDSTRVELDERLAFNDSLLMQNTALAQVVESAATINTTSLKGFGVIERSSGKLIPTERARRSDKIRVCFTVAKNKLIDAGDKELYVQVISPSNTVLGENAVAEFEDSTLNYSLISKFNYENSNLNICEFILPEEDEKFEKGLYIVKVFSDTEQISSSEFTLR